MFKMPVRLLSISLIAFLIPFYFARTSNITAAGPLTLSSGQVELASDKSEEYRIIARQLFSNLVISVSDSGDMSGEAKSPFNFELNGDNYSGQSSINVKGTFDREKRTIAGTYSYSHNRVRRGTHKSGNPYELEGSANYPDAKFTGSADGDTVKLELVNFGTVTYSGVTSAEQEDKTSEYQDQLNWAITSAAKENERNSKVYTGNITAELGEGGFSDMYGQVEVNVPQADGSYDEEDWNYAKLDGKTLPVGTHIKTFGKSGAIIYFGQIIVHLGPDSELVVGKTPDQPGQLEMLYGNLKANVKKMMKDGSMEVEMSQAVAGIKGTIFSLEDAKDKSTIKVIEGSVEFKSKATGQTEMVNAGETLSADASGLRQKTTFDQAAEEKQWQELADNFKKADTSFAGGKNLIYILGGIGLILVIISLLILKAAKSRKS